MNWLHVWIGCLWITYCFGVLLIMQCDCDHWLFYLMTVSGIMEEKFAFYVVIFQETVIILYHVICIGYSRNQDIDQVQVFKLALAVSSGTDVGVALMLEAYIDIELMLNVDALANSCTLAVTIGRCRWKCGIHFGCTAVSH